VAKAAPNAVITFNCTNNVLPVSKPIFIRKHLTIDGGGRISLDGRNSTRIFVDGRVAPTAQQGGEGILFKLRDITVQNASGSTLVGGSDNIADGAAVFVGAYGHFTGESVRFVGNKTGGNGGAISLLNTTMNKDGTKIRLIGCSFEGNEAQGSGGAIMMKYGSELLEITNTNFINNKSLCRIPDCTNNEGGGGAIRSHGTSRIVVSGNSRFEGNSTELFGGAIGAIQPRIEITGATFANNIARGTMEPRGGGAIYFDGMAGRNKAQLANNQRPYVRSYIKNSTFSRNQAPNRGGAIYGGMYGGDDLTIENTTFADNAVTQDRGQVGTIDNAGGCNTSNCAVTMQSVTLRGVVNPTGAGRDLRVWDTVRNQINYILRGTTIPGWT
jgi:predicted outer membrane repeat protein